MEYINNNNRGFYLKLLLPALILLLLCECSKDTYPPIARLTAFPTVADTTFSFEFSGSGSSDDNTYFEGLQFRWDFETDGIWDTNFQYQSVAVFQFKSSGLKTVTMEVKDSGNKSSKTSLRVEVKSANQWVDTLIDPRDGQKYMIVKLNKHWWMAGNLNYGHWISTNAEQLDNRIPEKYFLSDDSSRYAPLGGLYRWGEAMGYSAGVVQGLCPPGWHIPSADEWRSLLDNMDPWYAWTYYGIGGLSHLDIDLGAFARRRYNKIEWEPDSHFHWSSDYQRLDFLNEAAPLFFFHVAIWGSIGLNYFSSYYDGSDGLWSLGVDYASVRCVKNQ